MEKSFEYAFCSVCNMPMSVTTALPDGDSIFICKNCGNDEVVFESVPANFFEEIDLSEHEVTSET